MISSVTDISEATAQRVVVTDDALTVDLLDGRALSVPLAWYPRLWHAAPSERQNCQLMDRGRGIHWPDLDEDISIQGLLAGKPSGESQESLQRWLQGRTIQKQS